MQTGTAPIALVRLCRRLGRRTSVQLVIATLVTCAFFYELTRLVHTFRWLDHSDLALARGLELETELLDCETAVRGYLLTHDRRYLEPYDAAIPRLPETLRRLERHVADDSEQEQRLKSIETEIGTWRGSVDALLVDGSLGRLEATRQLMDSLRRKLQEFLSQELTLRRARNLESHALTRRVLVTGTALTFVLRMSFVTLWRVVRRRSSTQLQEPETNLTEPRQRGNPL